MVFDYTKAIVSLPKNNTDKIIGVLTGTISVAGAVSPTTSVTANDVQDTGFGDWCLFQGRYSIDSGVTWNEMGAQTPDLSVPGSPVFDTLDCRTECSPTGVFTTTVTNYVNPNTGTTSAKTVQFQILLLARKGQGLLTPIPTNSLPLYHSSRYNYQKIHIDDSGSFTTTAGTVGTLPIDHNLGYIPNVRAWTNTGGTIRQVIFQPEIIVSNTSLIFRYDAFFDFTDTTFNLIYRIYLNG